MKRLWYAVNGDALTRLCQLGIGKRTVLTVRDTIDGMVVDVSSPGSFEVYLTLPLDRLLGLTEEIQKEEEYNARIRGDS
jgi:hypothetical protein